MYYVFRQPPPRLASYWGYIPMQMTIAHSSTCGPIGGHNGLEGRLYPNGEVVLWKPKTMKMQPMAPPYESDPWALGPFLMALWGHIPPEALAQLAALGLSPHTNSDKLVARALASGQYPPPAKRRYGTKGITSYGARRVRNACYLVQSRVPKKSTVFATCTVPSMPLEEMRSLHDRWNVVVETYRRKLRRALAEKDLCTDSVTVSEVQGKRYERTGLPILHIHTVFGGRDKTGRPAISTKQHDRMWYDALSAALRGPVPKSSYACNMQWVKKSAESYLGKYMTKGCQVVNKMCADGFSGWLPKQWWSISAALGRVIDDETHGVREFAEWLNDVAEMEGSDVWLWHRDIQVELRSGDKVTMARYGKLNIRHVAQIQAYYRNPGG